VNEFYLFVKTLTPVSFTKCFPFFFLGYFCRQKKLISEKVQKKDIAFCIGGLLIGSITYIYVRQKISIPLYGISFWIMCISSIIGILCLCKLLDIVKSKIIVNISIGTIVIMGLHWMFIGTTNYVFAKLFHIDGGITYPPYIVIILTLIFVALEYPVILLFKNRFPFLLGKRIAKT